MAESPLLLSAGVDLASNLPSPTADAADMSPAETAAVLAAVENAAVSARAWAESRLSAISVERGDPNTMQEDGSDTNAAAQEAEALLIRSQLEALSSRVSAAAAAAAAARAPFQWADGPLVTAMRRGDMILVDEINLAEDAVLERLNRCALPPPPPPPTHVACLNMLKLCKDRRHVMRCETCFLAASIMPGDMSGDICEPL